MRLWKVSQQLMFDTTHTIVVTGDDGNVSEAIT